MYCFRVAQTLNKDYLLNGNFGHDYNAFCGFHLEIIVANSFLLHGTSCAAWLIITRARIVAKVRYVRINWDLYTFGNKQIWKINLMLILFIFRTNEKVLPEVYHSDNPLLISATCGRYNFWAGLCAQILDYNGKTVPLIIRLD